jgi:hypothetical protein
VTQYLARCDRCGVTAPTGARAELPPSWRTWSTSPQRHMTLGDAHHTLCDSCTQAVDRFIASGSGVVP